MRTRGARLMANAEHNAGKRTARARPKANANSPTPGGARLIPPTMPPQRRLQLLSISAAHCVTTTERSDTQTHMALNAYRARYHSSAHVLPLLSAHSPGHFSCLVACNASALYQSQRRSAQTFGMCRGSQVRARATQTFGSYFSIQAHEALNAYRARYHTQCRNARALGHANAKGAKRISR